MNAESWFWLDTGANGAALNMAVDEVLLLGAKERGAPLLRVYGWPRAAVSIGYFQAYPAEYEATHEIVRRPTGGGLVFHGHDLTFTVVAPPGHELFRLRVCDSYQRMHSLLAEALRRLGLDCSLRSTGANAASALCFESPVTHDIVLDGRKVCGGAQRRTKHGLLHQGSLLLPRSRRRPIEELSEGLRRFFPAALKSVALSDTEWRQAEDLAKSKYATEAWNKKSPGRRMPPAWRTVRVDPALP